MSNVYWYKLAYSLPNNNNKLAYCAIHRKILRIHSVHYLSNKNYNFHKHAYIILKYITQLINDRMILIFMKRRETNHLKHI